MSSRYEHAAKIRAAIEAIDESLPVVIVIASPGCGKGEFEDFTARFKDVVVIKLTTAKEGKE